MHGQPRLLAFLGLSVLLLMGGGAALALRTPLREPVQILLPPQSTAPAELKVYVSGAVQSPGVYLLASGDRVEDALRAAGGSTAEAGLERLNLASILRDGDHVFVPRRGEEAPPGKAGGPRINLNTASKAELDRLPGIGEVRAQRIIESRIKDGPFLDSWELVERRILPVSTYQQIKDLVTPQ